MHKINYDGSILSLISISYRKILYPENSSISISISIEMSSDSDDDLPIAELIKKRKIGP